VGSRPAWLPFVVVVLSVTGEMLLVGRVTDLVTRPALITAVVGLAAIAVAVGLFSVMGLGREVLGLRFLGTIPILLSITLTVVLILEANYRARVGGP
jgi:hypothetical protein